MKQVLRLIYYYAIMYGQDKVPNKGGEKNNSIKLY